jgi:hypothetical protein
MSYLGHVDVLRTLYCPPASSYSQLRTTERAPPLHAFFALTRGVVRHHVAPHCPGRKVPRRLVKRPQCNSEIVHRAFITILVARGPNSQEVFRVPQNREGGARNREPGAAPRHAKAAAKVLHHLGFIHLRRIAICSKSGRPKWWVFNCGVERPSARVVLQWWNLNCGVERSSGAARRERDRAPLREAPGRRGRSAPAAPPARPPPARRGSVALVALWGQKRAAAYASKYNMVDCL